MIAEFDCGNSSIKWRVLDDNGKRLVGGRSADIEAVISDVARYPIKAGRAVSVAGSAKDDLLQSQFEQFLGFGIWFAQTQAECAGLKNSYEFPERMGTDRWLAMLAARELTSQPLVVFDFGSALTADFVDVHGTHLGGYIMPGLPLMERGLFGNTGKVQAWGEAHDGRLEPGTSTGEAVFRGCRTMLMGACAEILERAGLMFSGFTVVITGGDSESGERVCQRMGIEYDVVQDLVLDGLAISWRNRKQTDLGALMGGDKSC